MSDLDFNPTPKFLKWMYEDYNNSFPEIRYLEPMTAYENKGELPTKGYIAEEKFDGHRALCYITPNGNRFFSRRISKKTNWFAENSDCVPHLRDFDFGEEFVGTVLDGELTMETFADVQGVTGALPETAIQNQLAKGFATFNVFDILYYKGMNVQHFPLWRRKLFLNKVLGSGKEYFKPVVFYMTVETSEMFTELKEGFDLYPNFDIVESYSALLEEFWEMGKEGLILKSLEGKYEQKRSKNFLKLKEIKTYDVVITGYQEPTRLYTGKEIETWEYWEDGEAVTKPYALGWVGAIEVGVYRDGKLVKVAEVKGITDADQEKIKANRENLIGKQVIEIKCQEIINEETKSMRHPRFNRWRDDKNAEDCLWELL